MSNKEVTLKENRIGFTSVCKAGYIDPNTRKVKKVYDKVEKVFMPELVCEITEYMDKFRKPQAIYIGDDGKDWMRVYICGTVTKNKNGESIIEPEKGEYNDPEEKEKHYFLWMRIPGYTCGNIVINKADDTIYEIQLVHKGGGFSGKNGSAFKKDTIKLEKELNGLFKGKKITLKPLES